METILTSKELEGMSNFDLLSLFSTYLVLKKSQAEIIVVEHEIFQRMEVAKTPMQELNIHKLLNLYAAAVDDDDVVYIEEIKEEIVRRVEGGEA